VVTGVSGSRGCAGALRDAVSHLVGLPGYAFAVGRWFEPLAIISFIVEALFVVLFFVAVSTRRA
jgi:hypothetical protein